MTSRRRERPIKRTNPSGKEVWVARYTAGREAQKRRHLQPQARGPGCDDEARTSRRGTGCPGDVGAYAASWTERHPRSERTNTTNDGRVRQVLDVELDGRRLRDWQFRELRRRHALALVAHMLTSRGAPPGALRTCCARCRP